MKTEQPTTALTPSTKTATHTKRPAQIDLLIDPELRACVPEPLPRDAKHTAKVDGVRAQCDAAEMQRRNLSKLVATRGVERPIYVWERGEDMVIVDGVKTYLAALEHGKPFDIKLLKFESLEEAKAFRWYVNVAAAGRLSEDAAVWAFLQQYDWMVKQWRDEGRENQSKQSLFLDCERRSKSAAPGGAKVQRLNDCIAGPGFACFGRCASTLVSVNKNSLRGWGRFQAG